MKKTSASTLKSRVSAALFVLDKKLLEKSGSEIFV